MIMALEYDSTKNEIFEDPDTEEYQYETFQDAADSIRLFQILPDTPDEPLRFTLSNYTGRRQLTQESRDLKYIAISYLWGSEVPLKLIYINGSPFFIRANLHTFVLQLRTFNTTDLLWVDAICINQGNIEERNAQVSMMGSIFKQATQIYAWIGTDTPKMASLFRTMNEKTYRGIISPHEYDYKVEGCYNHQKKPSYSTDEGKYLTVTVDEITILLEIWEQEYWNRTWIVQELRSCPENVMLWCGSSSVPFPKFKNFHYASMNLLLRDVQGTVLAKNRNGILNNLGNFSTRFFDQSHSSSLQTLTSHHEKSRCADPRDKIYALRALATDVTDNDLRPQYHQPVEALFWDVLGHITKWYCPDLMDCGHHPIWKLILQTLSLRIEDIRKNIQCEQKKSQTVDGLACRRFSQVLRYPSRVTVVNQSTSPGGCRLIEASDQLEPANKQSSTTKGNEYIGFTHAEVKEGDLLFRLKPASELSIVVRQSEGSSEFKFLGWAATAGHSRKDSTAEGWGPPSARSWCFIKGSMWTYQINDPSPKVWLPKKLGRALQDLQQSCDNLKDCIVVKGQSGTKCQTSEYSQSVCFSIDAEALIALWEYSEHPDRC